MEIKLIENLHFDEQLLCNSFGKAARPFMRQGDLDGACAIYSLMMMLILNKKVKRSELESRGKGKGYTSSRRLQDEFLGSIPGLYKKGFHFGAIAEKLHSSYGKIANATVFDESSMDKAQLHEKIKEVLDGGKPVEVGFTFKGGTSGHAVVAVGYISYKTRIQLLCFDPAYELPCNAFWNSIIDIETDLPNKVYSDAYCKPDSKVESVHVDEILIID